MPAASKCQRRFRPRPGQGVLLESGIRHRHQAIGSGRLSMQNPARSPPGPAVGKTPPGPETRPQTDPIPGLFDPPSTDCAVFMLVQLAFLLRPLRRWRSWIPSLLFCRPARRAALGSDPFLNPLRSPPRPTLGDFPLGAEVRPTSMPRQASVNPYANGLPAVRLWIGED